MSEPSDIPFLIARERQCRELALAPGYISVQLAHRNMADAYAERLANLADALPLKL